MKSAACDMSGRVQNIKSIKYSPVQMRKLWQKFFVKNLKSKHMKKLAFTFIIILTASCEKNIFDENYRYLYGDWIPVQLFSGISYDTNPELVGDIIQITKNGSYAIIQDEKKVESGKISVESQTKDELALRFIANEIDFGDQFFIRLPSTSVYVESFSQDSIYLHAKAVDAGYFALWLKRK